MEFKIPDTPEELFRQGRQKMNSVNHWFSPFVVLFAVLLFILYFMFYSVGPDEVGVIRRFGKLERVTDPGLHVKIPFAEKLDLVKIKKIFKEEFGFRTNRAGVKTQYSSKSFLDESLMLTGDLNVLDVTWIVQFKIDDPVKVLFKIKNPQNTIRDLSEAVMSQVIGDSSVDEALKDRRIEINREVREKLQEVLDSYESGIRVEEVKLQDVNPPDEVKPSFNEVNGAQQEREKVINQAWEAYNKVIPKAKGEAERTIREAEGYALQRINEAHGDASKFLSVYKAYKEAKEVTRRRLYLETLNVVLPKVGKVYIVEPEGTGIIPFLPLGDKIKP